MQIQRNLSTDSSVQDMQRGNAMVEVDSKAKVGASLGYNVRTLLKDLGLEVWSFNPSSCIFCLSGSSGESTGCPQTHKMMSQPQACPTTDMSVVFVLFDGWGVVESCCITMTV